MIRSFSTAVSTLLKEAMKTAWALNLASLSRSVIRLMPVMKTGWVPGPMVTSETPSGR